MDMSPEMQAEKSKKFVEQLNACMEKYDVLSILSNPGIFLLIGIVFLLITIVTVLIMIM